MSLDYRDRSLIVMRGHCPLGLVCRVHQGREVYCVEGSNRKRAEENNDSKEDLSLCRHVRPRIERCRTPSAKLKHPNLPGF